MDQGSQSHNKSTRREGQDGLPKLAARVVLGDTAPEQRRRYAAFFVAAVALILIAVTVREGSEWLGHSEPAATPRANETTPVSVLPDAVGDTISLSIWRGRGGAESFTAYPCSPMGSLSWLTLKYAEPLRPLVKALPTHIPLSCPTARVRVLEVTETHIAGELLELEGVKPAKDKVELPPGVDLGSYEAIEALGVEAVGKVGFVPFYRGATSEGRFVAYPCGNRTGDEFMYMTFGSAEEPLVRTVPPSARDHCRPLRFEVTGLDTRTHVFEAKLVGIESALLD